MTKDLLEVHLVHAGPGFGRDKMSTTTYRVGERGVKSVLLHDNGAVGIHGGYRGFTVPSSNVKFFIFDDDKVARCFNDAQQYVSDNIMPQRQLTSEEVERQLQIARELNAAATLTDSADEKPDVAVAEAAAKIDEPTAVGPRKARKKRVAKRRTRKGDK